MKIYRALAKMIRKADHPDLKQALKDHGAETEGQIHTLEAVFDLIGKRARGEKCEAIHGIIEEGESLIEDFGDSIAADAAIIFSCQAVEHYEITRYGSIRAFAEELGLDVVRDHIDAILGQEKAGDGKLSALTEGSINDAAAEYGEAEESALA
ncbi:ferritin-like domain-containing protein [Paracoccus litorisediminis]|uniref:YciE/YciF ferroxidase family protein n=1 Tax=Paracoccus litorisediminis TaxID=2006130 RepID=UPI00372F03A6